jgi:hypothetical protein
MVIVFFRFSSSVIAPIPTIVQVNTNLPTHVPKGYIHQPPNGRQPKDSPRGSSLRGNMLRRPPFNPHVGSFEWPTPNPHVFIQPWY